MKNKLILIVIVALGLSTKVNAQQDQHFSMFAESPLFLNPASAGFTEGDLRLFTNYRMQWMTVSDHPYQTISASADGRLFDQGGNFMGIGLSFNKEKAGTGAYETNVMSIPINYALMLGEENYLSFGLQPGFYQRTLRNAQLNWGNQWTGTEYNQAISSGELVLSQNYNVSRFDIGAGIYWDARIKKNAKISLGLSGSHLTKEQINFTSDESRLYRKVTIHGRGEFRRPNSNLTVMPTFAAFLQGPNKEVIVGSNYKFLLKSASLSTSYFEEVSLSIGTYFRVQDAIVLNAIFNFSGLSVGASYDMNISNLSTASKGVGGMEFFLRYQIQFGTRDLRNNRVKQD